jgi:hypothetical protein
VTLGGEAIETAMIGHDGIVGASSMRDGRVFLKRDDRTYLMLSEAKRDSQTLESMPLQPRLASFHR